MGAVAVPYSDGAETSGVAVGEDAVAVLHEREPVLADGAAGGDVLVADRPGLGGKRLDHELGVERRAGRAIGVA